MSECHDYEHLEARLAALEARLAALDRAVSGDGNGIRGLIRKGDQMSMDIKILKEWRQEEREENRALRRQIRGALITQMATIAVVLLGAGALYLLAQG